MPDLQEKTRRKGYFLASGKEVTAMADILETIAAIEWLVLGIATWWQLRKLNRRMSRALDELEEFYDG